VNYQDSTQTVRSQELSAYSQMDSVYTLSEIMVNLLITPENFVLPNILNLAYCPRTKIIYVTLIFIIMYKDYIPTLQLCNFPIFTQQYRIFSF